MQKAVDGRWNVEQQFPVATDSRKVKLDQILYRADAVVLAGMIKPTRSDRDIDLGRSPHSAMGIAVLKCVDDVGTVGTRIRNARWIDRRPIGIAGDTALITAPAHVRPGIRKNHRVRLQSLDMREEPWPIINLAFAVW